MLTYLDSKNPPRSIPSFPALGVVPLALVKWRWRQWRRATFFSIVSLALDQTSERLTIHLRAGDRLRKARSAWHVLVSQVGITVCTPTAATDEPLSLRHLDVVRPPVPLVDTSAGSIYSGLFSMPCLKEQTEAEEALLRGSKFSIFHVDRDAASANDLVVGSRVVELPDKGSLWRPSLWESPSQPHRAGSLGDEFLDVTIPALCSIFAIAQWGATS